MSYFQRIAEQKIQEAIRNGEFDNLEGSGKPLDHSDYFSAPPELRMSFHLLKNAGVVPEEVELLNSIHRITGILEVRPYQVMKRRDYKRKGVASEQVYMLKEHRTLQGPNL